VDCDAAPAFCSGTCRGVSCSGGAAACAEARITAEIVEMLEFGAELAACPEAISVKKNKLSPIVISVNECTTHFLPEEKKSKPNLIVNTVRRNMRYFLGPAET
jgi:hypothetical protein